MFEKRLYADAVRNYGIDDPRTREAESKLREREASKEDVFEMLDEEFTSEGDKTIAEVLKEFMNL